MSGNGKKILSIRKLIHPFVQCLALNSQPFHVIQENAPVFNPTKPIIYAANHSSFPDGPVMSSIVPRWTMLFAGKQRLDLAGKLFFFLNGTIWVDRKDKMDMNLAKDTIIQSLRKGNDLIWFPEATWNVTENLPMLPMRWGIIEVARRADAQIIPTALHYDRERMELHIRWGKSMEGVRLQDNASGIRILRDTIASMRWEFWERNEAVSRANLDVDECRRKMKTVYEEYKSLSIEDEQATVFCPYPTQEAVFADVYKLQPRKDTAFLFNKRIV